MILIGDEETARRTAADQSEGDRRRRKGKKKHTKKKEAPAGHQFTSYQRAERGRTEGEEAGGREGRDGGCRYQPPKHNNTDQLMERKIQPPPQKNKTRRADWKIL